MSTKVLDAATEKFGDKVTTESQFGDEVIHVAPANLIEVATWLRDDRVMSFDAPVFVTCIDRLGLDQEDPRFELCVQLRSTTHRHRIRVKVPLAGEPPKVPSLAALWPGLSWQERETFDMYGVVFEDHGDLRRIYMYEEFEGHPLRKDYPKDRRQPLVRRDWND